MSCRPQQAQTAISKGYVHMIRNIKQTIPEYTKPYTFPLSLYSKPVFLQSQKNTVMHFEAYCRFPIISYIPQVVGIYIGLLFAFNPYTTFFLGRAMLFIVSFIWIQKLIKFSPKLLSSLYLLVFCMPLFIHQATSYGYDAIPVLLFFTFFSHIWIMTTTKNLSVRKWIAASVLLLLFLLSRRGGYEPLAVLFFLPLVPISPKKRVAHWWVSAIALVGAIVYIFLLYINYTSYGSSGRPLGANPVQQLALMQQHPQNMLVVIALTLLTKSWFYLLSTIGTLGMLEYRVSSWVYLLYAAWFALVILNSKQEYKNKSSAVIYYLLGVVVIQILYLMFVLYVTWTVVGNPVVEGVQGRYFWPVIPLIGLVLVHVLPKKMKAPSVPPALVHILALSATVSIAYTVIQRYFL